MISQSLPSNYPAARLRSCILEFKPMDIKTVWQHKKTNKSNTSNDLISQNTCFYYTVLLLRCVEFLCLDILLFLPFELFRPFDFKIKVLFNTRPCYIILCSLYAVWKGFPSFAQSLSSGQASMHCWKHVFALLGCPVERFGRKLEEIKWERCRTSLSTPEP